MSGVVDKTRLYDDNHFSPSRQKYLSLYIFCKIGRKSVDVANRGISLYS